jgi:hypothetical protein
MLSSVLNYLITQQNNSAEPKPLNNFTTIVVIHQTIVYVLT